MAWKFASQLALLSLVIGVADATACSSDGTCPGDLGDVTSAMQLNAPRKQQETTDGATTAPTDDEDIAAGTTEETIDGATTAPIIGEDIAAGTTEEPLWELINSDKLTEELPWNAESKRNPSCLQGIAFMDQTCLAYPDLPRKDRIPCSGRLGWQNEYTVTFGKWNGTCFRFQRDTWTFGAANLANGSLAPICRGTGALFCMMGKGGDPCKEGTHFKNPGSAFELETTSYGFARLTSGRSYPLLPIVDGKGQRTKWFDLYHTEVTQTSCPSGSRAPLVYPRDQKCRRSQWAAQGQIARCLHG